MIGLAKLPSGAYSLTLAGAPLFLMVRRRRIVYAEWWARDGSGAWRWTADPDTRPAGLIAGYRALIDKVVMPAG